ncbi:glycosyltransferase family 2 protein, partial [Holdemania filiformis]|uniref:glycosyltransferase family 2 protein n=1 Tax=Holdemania filiformis TaxID=61171 RepID=UPI0026773EF5
MDNEVRISVIIPFFNSEKYLEPCLNSVLSQKYSNYEIILVNDGSTDKSEDKALDIINSHKCDYNYYYQENCGVSSARNYGIRKATGEYIVFLDSDDYLVDEYCFSCINQAAKENTADLIVFLHIDSLKKRNYVKPDHIKSLNITPQKTAEEIYRNKLESEFNFTGICS